MSEAANVASRADLDDKLRRLFLSDPAVMADPVPIWTELREAGPVYHHGKVILFTKSRGVKKLINDPRAVHNAAGKGKRAEAARAALPDDGKTAFDVVTAFEGMYMSRNDGETHDRLRRIAQRTFTPKRIGQIGEIIETTAQQYLTDLAAQGPVVDFMEFAYSLPLKIIGDLLAIPGEDLAKVHEWSSRLGRNRGGTDYQPLMDAHRALGEFRAYVTGIIKMLRDRPRSDDEIDLIGDLLDANQQESLDDAELVAMFVVLLFAGHETTTNLIGTGLLSLLRTGEWGRLVGRPDQVSRAVEELVRYVSPVQWLSRNIAEPMEVEGQALSPGDTVLLMIASANRDPELFPDRPEALDIERDARGHLGFGRGSHICLGSHLAKMEAISAFTALVNRFPDLKLAAADVTWSGNASLRGLAALPIALGEERRR
jgi:cytochrome P450